MDYPDVDPDSEELPEPVGREPREGETATHTRRVLLADILTAPATPDEPMHRVAAAQLDTIDETRRVDRNGWSRLSGSMRRDGSWPLRVAPCGRCWTTTSSRCCPP